MAANELKKQVDTFITRPEFQRRFKFREQLDDAGRSEPRNIAEGFARFKHKEFAQFVRVANGSEAEVLNHFIDAHDQRLRSNDEFLMAEHLTRRGILGTSPWHAASGHQPLGTPTHGTHGTHRKLEFPS